MRIYPKSTNGSRYICVKSPLVSLHWRHNDHDGVPNHQPHGCLLNRLFRRRSKKTSKLRVTGLCVWNSPGPVTKGQLRGKCFHLMTSSCRAGETAMIATTNAPACDTWLHGGCRPVIEWKLTLLCQNGKFVYIAASDINVRRVKNYDKLQRRFRIRKMIPQWNSKHPRLPSFMNEKYRLDTDATFRRIDA